MAFRFRLEKVLRYRRRRVDLQARAVAEAAARVAELTNRQNQLRLAQKEAADAGAQAHDVARRGHYAAWITRLEDEIANLEILRSEATDHLAEQRLALQEAWREREVLEHLRQRNHADWQSLIRRRERADLDEIGQQRALARDRQQRTRQAELLAVKPGTGTADGA